MEDTNCDMVITIIFKNTTLFSSIIKNYIATDQAMIRKMDGIVDALWEPNYDININIAMNNDIL